MSWKAVKVSRGARVRASSRESNGARRDDLNLKCSSWTSERVTGLKFQVPNQNLIMKIEQFTQNRKKRKRKRAQEKKKDE